MLLYHDRVSETADHNICLLSLCWLVFVQQHIVSKLDKLCYTLEHLIVARGYHRTGNMQALFKCTTTFENKNIRSKTREPIQLCNK